MNQPTNTQLNQHPQTTPMDATTIANNVLLARAALDFGAQNLSHDVTERLRVARMRALAASQSSKVSQAPQPDVSNFNFGQWFHHLSGWLRGGLATGAIAIAFLLTFGTTQSDLDRLSSHKADAVATYYPAHGVMASLPEIQANRALGSNTIANNQNKAKPRTAELTTMATVDTSTLSTNASNHSMTSVNADDEQVDIFLREKIPLQAYLNDDFNQYANRQDMNDGGTSIENNNPNPSR